MLHGKEITEGRKQRLVCICVYSQTHTGIFINIKEEILMRIIILIFVSVTGYVVVASIYSCLFPMSIAFHLSSGTTSAGHGSVLSGAPQTFIPEKSGPY